MGYDNFCLEIIGEYDLATAVEAESELLFIVELNRSPAFRAHEWGEHERLTDILKINSFANYGLC